MAANTVKGGRFPRTYEVQDSVTRPAGNTTQYAAGDAISDNATTATAAGYFALDFKTKGEGYGGLMLTDFTLHKSDQDQTAAAFALLLFTTAPAFAGFEDNVALGITDAEMEECKGVVRFAAAGWANVALGDIQTVSQDIGIVMGANSTIIYGILVAQDTYTPGDAEKFTLTVHAKQD